VIDANGTLIGMVIGRDTRRPKLGVALPAEAIDMFLRRHQIADMPSIPSSPLAADTEDLLKAISVLVQCAPPQSAAFAVP
jgi:hypothetical protein